MHDQSAEASLAFALESGYQRDVERACASTIPREEVFVTTKFNKQWHGVDLVA